MWISRQPNRISKKPDTLLLIDALWIRLCSHLLILGNLISNKVNRRTLGRFTPYRLLTLPKRKHHCWNCNFFRKEHLSSFLLIYSFVGVLLKLACAQFFFFRRAPAKVGSNLKRTRFLPSLKDVISFMKSFRVDQVTDIAILYQKAQWNWRKFPASTAVSILAFPFLHNKAVPNVAHSDAENITCVVFTFENKYFAIKLKLTSP